MSRRVLGVPRRVSPTMAWSRNNAGSPRKARKYAENWKEFARKSTCAAVSHLGESSQSLPVKITWRVTLIVGITLMAVSTFFSTRSFADISGTSEMLLKSTAGSWSEHPKYHICTTNTFNTTILSEMGFTDAEMVSYLLLLTSIFTTSPVLYSDMERQRQLELKFNNILSRNGIEDVNDIIQRALLKCEDIIAGCIAPGVYVDGAVCCAKYFPSDSFISHMGACVTTTYAPPMFQQLSTVAFGFVVFVRDLHQHSHRLDNSILNPILINQKGVFFSVSDKWTHPMLAVSGAAHFTRFGTRTALAISKTIVDDEDVQRSFLAKLARKTCAARSDQDQYKHLVPWTNYTESNCIFSFHQKGITKSLNCYLATFPYQGNLTACRPKHMISLAKLFLDVNRGLPKALYNKAPDCISECTKEMYSFSASYSDLKLAPNFKFGNWSIPSNQSQHLASLNFYYPVFTHTELVNHYPTLTQWLGIVGGNLGLFLGASMVTLIELLVFIFTCFRP